VEPAPAAPPAGSSATHRAAGEVERLARRIKEDPTSPTPYLQLAALYRRADEIDKARHALEEGLPATGHHFELALELADLEIEPLRRNLAVAEARLQAHPDKEDVRRLRLGLLREINSREMELFRRRAERFPTELVHRFELGVRLLRAGKVDEAIKELQAARSDPRLHWKALMFLGHCFRSRHNWRLASRNFEDALQHLPPGEDGQRKEILFHLATGYAEAGELARAIDLGHELANLDFGFRDINRLLDEWQAKLEEAAAGPPQ
jgi:tetratricopeptide (TPR) repeat protein